MSDELLLREAIRAAETHDWIRNQLMVDKRGRLVFVLGFSGGARLRARDDGVSISEAGEIECDEVAACCAVGYLRFADVCLLPVTGESSGSGALQSQLEQLLWSKPEVRAAYAHHLDPSDLGYGSLTLQEIAEEEGLVTIGLLPFWNDHIAGSKDDVIALFTEALEGITPA